MLGVVGVFLVNPEGDVCFAQAGEHQKIVSLRLVAGPSAIAVYPDGSEDMFTSEIHTDILTPMLKKSEILIAHIDENGEAVEEYNVPLINNL